MYMKPLLSYLSALFLILLTATAQANQSGDAITGTWKAVNKALTVQIYKRGTHYYGKIISFEDHKSKVPAAERRDEKNPNPGLRNRKVLGMEVLTNLTYDPSERTWKNGRIYHINSGKTYSVSAGMEGGKLVVRAYKGFSMLGKSYTFVQQ